MAVSALGFLLYYGAIMDLSEYVEEVAAHRFEPALESVDELVVMPEEGEELEVTDSQWAALDRATDQLEELEAGIATTQGADRDQLTDLEADRLVAEWAAVGLSDPMALLAPVNACGAETARAEEFRAAVEELARSDGWFALAVIRLNSWRMDDLFQEQMARSRSSAESSLSHMTAEQRAVFDSSCEAHGSALMHALLRMGHLPSSEDLRRALLQVAEALADQRPERREEPALEERLSAILADNEEAELALASAQCTVHPEVIHDPLIRLRLLCTDEGLGPDPVDALLVDLERGQLIRAIEGAAAALDVVEAEIRRVFDETGEVPEIGGLAPAIEEAHTATRCDVDYEPLGLYDEAEITTDCGGEQISRHVQFPPGDE